VTLHFSLVSQDSCAHSGFDLFIIWLNGLRLPHPATSLVKVLGRRTLRSRHDMDTLRSKPSLARCLQAQEGGAIQTKPQKVVKIGEVRCINC
jgi:hypothetical protein